MSPTRAFVCVLIGAPLLTLGAAAPLALADPAPEAAVKPFADDRLYRAFHGREGVHRITVRLLELNVADPRIADIFKGQDLDHLQKMLETHLCWILGGPCVYTGKDMKAAHKDLGLQMSDFNALVENLQKAMDREGVPFRDQNRLLAKLAPMERDIVVRSGAPKLFGH